MVTQLLLILVEYYKQKYIFNKKTNSINQQFNAFHEIIKRSPFCGYLINFKLKKKEKKKIFS